MTTNGAQPLIVTVIGSGVRVCFANHVHDFLRRHHAECPCTLGLHDNQVAQADPGCA